tara:strand:- start:11377 stop:11730 length:354 start_codon:yes stop_codon:yes gene_type:complete
MTDLNLDLNINNYSNSELKKLLYINIEYNNGILKEKINILKEKIFALHISNKEKNEFNIFFNSVEIRLNKYLETKKIEDNQITMNKEIKNLKKQIQKNNTTNNTINKENNTKKMKKN